MKRDPRLVGLSHHHHYALVLSRHVRVALDDPEKLEAARAELLARHDEWLEPHFRLEEELLLPGLTEAGHGELAEQVQTQHSELRELFEEVPHGDVAALGRFAKRLHDHVRFEERELFGVCEEVLPDAVLEEVRRRSAQESAGG